MGVSESDRGHGKAGLVSNGRGRTGRARAVFTGGGDRRRCLFPLIYLFTYFPSACVNKCVLFVQRGTFVSVYQRQWLFLLHFSVTLESLAFAQQPCRLTTSRPGNTTRLGVSELQEKN